MADSAGGSRLEVHFVVPGALETRTGGYGYDRRIIAGLRERGWAVDVREIPGAFPHPSSEDRERMRAGLRGLPDRSTVVVDGLAFGAAPGEVAAEAGRLRFVALVHHPLAEETGLAPPVAAALAAGERRALAAARLVVVTSGATARRLDAYGVTPSRVAIVEPGTDPAPLAHGSGDRLVHLLSVGALVPRKGHLVLIAALAGIAEHNWRLVCVGSVDRAPATVEAVRASIRASGLDDRVVLTGEGDAARMACAYDAADVFVLPTFHEGYGMAVAEAIACGLPVISTPTGAIPDLVGSDAGILVPAGNVAALAAALARVLGDAGLRSQMTAGARRRRTGLPTWNRAAAAFSAALESVRADG